MLRRQRYMPYNWKGKGNITFNNKAFCYVAVNFQQLKIQEGYNQVEGPEPTEVMPRGIAPSTFQGEH